MAAEPMPHQGVENKNQALWDEIGPVHPKAYKEVTLLREGGARCSTRSNYARSATFPSSGPL